jgi:predicted nucleic acid-binding protein
MVALDTNIVIDLGVGSADFSEAAQRAIERAAKSDSLVICGAVYAELCASPVLPHAEIDSVLRASQIRIDVNVPLDVWAEAGAAYGAFAQRRRSSGGSTPRRILADFIIGAHACRAGSLVTRDGNFYKRAFPQLRVVDTRDFTT